MTNEILDNIFRNWKTDLVIPKIEEIQKSIIMKEKMFLIDFLQNTLDDLGDLDLSFEERLHIKANLQMVQEGDLNTIDKLKEEEAYKDFKASIIEENNDLIKNVANDFEIPLSYINKMRDYNEMYEAIIIRSFNDALGFTPYGLQVDGMKMEASFNMFDEKIPLVTKSDIETIAGYLDCKSIQNQLDENDLRRAYFETKEGFNEFLTDYAGYSSYDNHLQKVFAEVLLYENLIFEELGEIFDAIHNTDQWEDFDISLEIENHKSPIIKVNDEVVNTMQEFKEVYNNPSTRLKIK